MEQRNSGTRLGLPRYSVAAGLAFLAFAALFGSVVHVLSEVWGLGWSVAGNSAFWQRHEYLTGIVAAAVGSLLLAVRMLPRSAQRMQIATLVRALPFEGRGTGFAATVFAAQFAFSAFTQLCEGNPLSRGDLLTGIVAGILGALCGALIVTLCKRRILELALALVWATLRAAFAAGAANGIAAYGGPTAPSARRTPYSFRYRPPPLAA
jgi:hypothetical protein